MGYSVTYTGSRKERLEKAFQDAQDWICDKERMNKILEATKIVWDDYHGLSGKKNCIKGIRFNLSFAGIQGVPVTAIIRMALYGTIK